MYTMSCHFEKCYVFIIFIILLQHIISDWLLLKGKKSNFFFFENGKKSNFNSKFKLKLITTYFL